MKIKTSLIAICDLAIIDEKDKLSICNIFDEIYIQKFPGGFIDKSLVVVLKGEPNKRYYLSLHLEEKGSRENLLSPTTTYIQMNENGGHNWVIRLADVEFPKQGDYRFVIYYGKEEVGATDIQAIKL